MSNVNKKILLFLYFLLFIPSIVLAIDTTANTIVLNGTIRDFYDWSKDHSKNPDFEHTCSFISGFIGTCEDYPPPSGYGSYPVTGLVQNHLDSDKKPVLNSNTGQMYDRTHRSITDANSFSQWYRDVEGINMSKEYNITLTKNGDVYTYENHSFFPIDGELLGNEGPYGSYDHNYHFTYEIHSKFTYQGGETFTFAGDDDVWVFINNELVIDIGGIHGSVERSVDLDTLGLIVGETYDFDFFFAERHITGSNFKITTSIELEDSSESSPEPIPFTCNSQSFISFNTSQNGPKEEESQFDTISLSDGKLKDHKVLNGVEGVNSIGYNIKDNYIWGYNLQQDKIIKIGVDGNTKLFDLPEGLDADFYIAADVDKNGILYLATRGADEIQRVNVDESSDDFLKVLDPLKLKEFDMSTNRTVTISTADIAFNPKDGFIYYIEEGSGGKIYKIDPDTGIRSFVVNSGVDPYVVISYFDKDGNFYFNLGTGDENRKLYKIDMNDPETAKPFADLDKNLTNGDGARCPNAEVQQPNITNEICYAIDDTKSKLYYVYMDPNAQTLPLAKNIKLDFSNVPENKRNKLNGEGGAYNSADGLIYAFYEKSTPYLYSINPDNGEVKYIKTFPKASEGGLKENITGASFYGGYFYVIAKSRNSIDATLYKINVDNWEIISKIDLNGDTTDADALAINDKADAYIINDGTKKIYSIDIKTAKTKYKTKITTNTEAEGLSFAKDGNLYVENSEEDITTDTDKIFKIDISSGALTAAAQIPHGDDIDIEGLSCNINVPSESDTTELNSSNCEQAPDNLVNFNSEFKFSKINDVSGDGSKGTVARYKNVATVNGEDVDLLVKVIDLKGVNSLYQSDSTPKGFKFQKIHDEDPSVGFFINSKREDPKGTEYEATLKFTFVKSETNEPVNFNFETQVYDIDNFENRTELLKIAKDDYLFFQTSDDTHIVGTRKDNLDIFKNSEDEDSQDFDKKAMVKFVHKDTSSFTMKFSQVKNKDSGSNVGKAGFNLVFGRTKLGLDSCGVSLIADYHFDECSWDGLDGEVKDSSGNGYDGKVMSRKRDRDLPFTTNDEKVINRSAKFTITEKHFVKVTDINSFDNRDFSVSMWIKLDNYESGWQTLIVKGSENNSADGVLRIKYNYNYGNEKIGINTTLEDGSPERFYKRGIGLKDKEWHHLAVTYKKGVFKLYLDKEVILNKKIDNKLIEPNDELYIGGKYYSANMYIDEVKIFNGALSTDKIEEIYENEKNGKNYDGSEREIVNCNKLTVGTCFTVNEETNKLYSFDIKRESNRLTSLKVEDLDFSEVPDEKLYSLDQNAIAYNSYDHLLYIFSTQKKHLILYSINPNSNKVHFVEDLHDISSEVAGASFYNGMLYLITKSKEDGDSKIYKIDSDNWKVLSSNNLNGDINFADSLAINSKKDAFITAKKKIYKIDLTNAKTTYVDNIEDIDSQGFSFALDNNLYIENVDKTDRLNSHLIYRLNTTDWGLTPVVKFDNEDIFDLESLACDTNTSKDIVYATINDVNGTEGNNGVKNFVFTVKFSKPTPKGVSFWVTFTDGVNAIYPRGVAVHASNHIHGDFGGEAREIIVPVNTTEYNISVPVYGDTFEEPNEEFYVDLYAPSNKLEIVDNRGVGLILDDDTKNIINAWGLEHGSINNPVIHTKIVNKTFGLYIASLNYDRSREIPYRYKDVKIGLFDKSGVQIVGYQDVNTTLPHEIKYFTINRPYKYVYAKFVYKDDQNITHESNATDPFAVRPKSYVVSSKKSPLDNLYRAGKEFEIKIDLKDFNDNNITQFNENNSSYSVEYNETNYPTCLTGVLDLNKTGFINGVAKLKASYSEVGILDLRVKEVNGSEFAIIDKDDGTGIDRFIEEGHLSNRFHPAKLSAIFNFNTLNDNTQYTYYSNNAIDMGAKLDLNITVLNDKNQTVSNFVSGCYSDDIDVDISYQRVGNSDNPFFVNRVDNSDANVTLLTNLLKFKVDKNSFVVGGRSSRAININFPRAINRAKEPVKFTLLNTNSSILPSTIVTAGAINRSISFVYARAHAPKEQSIVGDSINAAVDYEVYLPLGVNGSDYGLPSKLIDSEDDIYWYKFPNFDSAFGYKLGMAPELRYASGATIGTVTPTSIEIRADKTPYSNRVIYFPKDHLIFNKFNPSASSHNFRVNFYSANSTWVGKGKQGSTVDDKISNRGLKKMEW